MESSKQGSQPVALDRAVCGDSEPVPELRNDPTRLPDPAYLNACSLRWQREREASAGWELVQALRSADPCNRAIAAAFLAQTEDARIPRRAVRRAGDTRTISVCDEGDNDKAAAMKTPLGKAWIEDCVGCTARKDQWFCAFSPAGLKVLDGASHPSTFPDGALLFIEGQQARGAFVLCTGQAKLSTTSREGKVLILGIAGSGEVLGLSAALSAGAYELTAETSGPCHINFVERRALLTAVESSPEFGLHTALVLSRQIRQAYREIHGLVLSRSSTSKLARLLLSWSHRKEQLTDGGGIRVPATLTHEEMAQMIGSSRETVTRLLGELRKRELIHLDGSTLVIRDRGALEALAA